MEQSNQLTAEPFTLDGISSSDPDGHVPPDILINGTKGRIPRWANFPQKPLPGEDEDYTELYVCWEQSSKTTEIFNDRYTYINDKPEFEFDLTAEHMIEDGVAEIYYVLVGRNGNPDESPTRKLTIVHALTPTLRPPAFPNADLYGYINCDTDPWVGEKIRVQIVPEAANIFQYEDVCVLIWQGFATLNGSLPVLTPQHTFREIIDGDKPVKGFVIDIPFDPFIRPMFDKHSAIARYTILRRGVPIYASHPGLVKIDRIEPGCPVPCGGGPLK
ncbi:hypothetical protein [Pseudomonas sp. Marseille-Q5117]|uniref:hypothetical protein n=1 Tax=Pseudomonas sp. Marseille-Q5117 TaxID=2972777 RepID=UPI0021C87ECF|nr:hypothetical protein [Pseudomonas sp. Marseille-Q5117]